MVKFMIMMASAILLMAGLATAEVYKCKDAQGTIIYTDDTTKMPRGCNTEQAVKFPQLNVVPAQSAPPDISSPPASPASSAQQGDDGASYEALKGEADALAAQYAVARKKATFSPLLKNKEAAKAELKEILRHRDRLVGEIEKSALQQTQKNAILGKLSSVAE